MQTHAIKCARAVAWVGDNLELRPCTRDYGCTKVDNNEAHFYLQIGTDRSVCAGWPGEMPGSLRLSPAPAPHPASKDCSWAQASGHQSCHGLGGQCNSRYILKFWADFCWKTLKKLWYQFLMFLVGFGMMGSHRNLTEDLDEYRVFESHYNTYKILNIASLLSSS